MANMLDEGEARDWARAWARASSRESYAERVSRVAAEMRAIVDRCISEGRWASSINPVEARRAVAWLEAEADSARAAVAMGRS